MANILSTLFPILGILNSNKIYVIDKGKVIGEGTHEELIKNSEVYKNFYEKQIQKS